MSPAELGVGLWHEDIWIAMREEPDPGQAAKNDLNEKFLRLYADQHGRIYAFIGTFLRQASDIDDVLQETTIVLWRKFDQYDPSRDFVRWACGIAYREVLRFLRQRSPQSLPLEEAVLDAVAQERMNLTDHLEQRRLALSDCLGRLPPRDRVLVEQYYQPSMTAAALAEQMGRPVNSMHQSLMRIRGVLHECISRTVAALERHP